MGAFSGLRGAKRGHMSNRVKPGKYVVRIDGCDMFNTEKSGDVWKNTLTVLKVLEGEGHKEGEVVNTTNSSASGRSVFLQNVKTFIAGVLDASDDDVGEEEAEAVLREDSPIKGLCTVLTVQGRTSKKSDEKGLPFTYEVYGYSPALSEEEVREYLSEEEVTRFFPNGF